MFIRSAIGLLLLFSCGSLAAQDSRPLTITDAGYFLTVTDSDGIPAYVKLTTVIDLTGGETPDPEDPDVPNVDTELAEKVRDWAKAVGDPQSAQAIAAVYAHIRGALDDGVLTNTNVWTPLKQSMDSALGVIASESNWSEFRAKLTAEFTEAQQRGRLGTAEQVSVVLLSVQHGVELAADGSTAISMDQLVEIARRTNMAIDGVTK